MIPFAFFLTGTAALIYQVVWQRLLALILGGDLRAATVIVAAFMCGLGFGSLAGGHLADRLERRGRLLLFAAAEGFVGLLALASTTVLYGWLYPMTAGWTFPATAAIVFSATCVPTFLMGMSLPLLSNSPARAGDLAGEWVPRIYGLNTLGAAAGAFASVTVVLRHVDFPTALAIGAALSLIAAAVVGAAARSTVVPRMATPGTEAATRGPEAAARLPASSGMAFRTWVALYVLSGFTALSLELVWFRALGVMLKSNALTFGLLLAFYLVGLGAGSLAATDRRWRRVDHANVYLTLQGAALVVAVGSVFLVVPLAGSGWLGDGVHAYLASPDASGVPGMTAVMYALLPAVLIVPATLLMGLAFGSLQRAVQTDSALVGRRTGWLQTANIAGSMAGAIVTGFWALGHLGSTGTLRLLGLTAITVLLYAVWRARQLTRARAALVIAGVSAVVAGAPNAAFWPMTIGAHASSTVVGEDGTGVVMFRDRDDDRTDVFIGGFSQSWLPYGGVHTALGALPVFVHPAPRAIAVIGLASGDSLYAAGANAATERLVNIEIMSAQHPTLAGVAARRPFPALTRLLDDPRIAFVSGDGRAYLRQHPRAFDIVQADALLPRGPSAGTLYSVEYFTLVREALAPGGLAVSWLPTARTLAGFVRAFPYVVRLGTVGLGSAAPIPFSRERLDAAIAAHAAYFDAGGIDIAEALGPYLEAGATLIGPDSEARRVLLGQQANRDLFPMDEFGVPEP